jgi:hypothetical protein
VSFDNGTGRGLQLEIQDQVGKTLYSKHYPEATAFKGIFDLSQLGDGEYFLKISTLTKAGFVKQAYRRSFHIHSQTNRSIAPAEQAPQIDNIPAYQVRR